MNHRNSKDGVRSATSLFRFAIHVSYGSKKKISQYMDFFFFCQLLLTKHRQLQRPTEGASGGQDGGGNRRECYCTRTCRWSKARVFPLLTRGSGTQWEDRAGPLEEEIKMEHRISAGSHASAQEGGAWPSLAPRQCLSAFGNQSKSELLFCARSSLWTADELWRSLGVGGRYWSDLQGVWARQLNLIQARLGFINTSHDLQECL